MLEAAWLASAIGDGEKKLSTLGSERDPGSAGPSRRRSLNAYRLPNSSTTFAPEQLPTRQLITEFQKAEFRTSLGDPMP